MPQVDRRIRSALLAEEAVDETRRLGRRRFRPVRLSLDPRFLSRQDALLKPDEIIRFDFATGFAFLTLRARIELATEIKYHIQRLSVTEP